MRTNDKTPSEVIDYIGDIIRERQQKSLPTFYTILIEQYEKSTPVAEKEEGYDNFKQQVLKYMSDYNLSSITVQLFSGKSRNVKSPFQTFKVQLKKQNPTIVLGGTEKPEIETVQHVDSSIPVGRYYDEKFELQMRIMRIEMEKQALTERLHQLTERYEDKLKEQDKRFEEKIKLLDLEVQRLEEEIAEYEKEIAKNEKDKHNSFGNIALGSISARAIENFAKSDLGTGLLKGLLGKDGYDNLQGHLAGIESEKNNVSTPPSARIISETDTNPRAVAINYITQVIQSLPDMPLRMLYDITQLSENNLSDLQVLWNVLQQIKKQRAQRQSPGSNKTKETKAQPEESEETEEEETNNDT
jgi:hypothetical protein